MKASLSVVRKIGPFLVIYFGLIWLWRFGWAHWPKATDTVAIISGGMLAAVYIWQFFIVPFREGWKGPGRK